MDVEDAVLIGGAIIGKAIHDNTNDRMTAQGIRPSWGRRHVILVMLLHALWITPLIFLALLQGPNLLVDITSFDKHHGNTGLIDLACVLAPVVVLGIRAYLRAERRWNSQPVYSNSQVVDVEPYRH